MTGPTLTETQCSTEIESPVVFDYLDVLYGTLFNPVRTFRLVAKATASNNRPFFYAIASIVLVSAMAPMIAMGSLGGDPADLALGIPLSVIGGLIAWSVTGLLVSLLSYAFTKRTGLRVFLTLSGLATLPWIMAGPVSMLKIGLGTPGFALFVLLSLAVWLWSVLLFAIAMMESFRMSPERVLIVLAAPFAMSLILLAWVAGFIENIRQIATT